MKRVLVLISNYGEDQLDYCQKLIEGLLKINGYKITIKIFSSNHNYKYFDYFDCQEIIVNKYKDHDFSLSIYDYLNDNKNQIIEDYDYLLVTENDIIFTQNNFDTYFKYESEIENDEYTIGFLRYEIKDGEKYLIDLHYSYSIDYEKGNGIIDYIKNKSMISLINPHQGCFMMKSYLFYKTLPKISIGHSLEDKVSKIYYSENHVGSKYGLKKYLPIKDLESLLIHHQPNKYINIFTKMNKIKELITMEHFYQNIDGWSTELEQGNLLKTILEYLPTQDLKIAEIGVYQGRGTAMWNVILMNNNINYTYFAIDHFLGSSEHDNSIDYYSIALKNLMPILSKIRLIKNESVDESKNYQDEYFDIVYIDASHEYEYVKEDILSWLPKVKKGGIICGDDYIAGWPGVIKAVDEIFDKVNVVGQQQWWVKKSI